MLLTDKFWCRERGGWKCPTEAREKESYELRQELFKPKRRKYIKVKRVDTITSSAWGQLMLKKCHHR